MPRRCEAPQQFEFSRRFCVISLFCMRKNVFSISFDIFIIKTSSVVSSKLSRSVDVDLDMIQFWWAHIFFVRFLFILNWAMHYISWTLCGSFDDFYTQRCEIYSNFLCFNFFFQISSDTQTPFYFQLSFQRSFILCIAVVLKSSNSFYPRVTLRCSKNCETKFLISSFLIEILSTHLLAKLDFFTQKIDKAYQSHNSSNVSTFVFKFK